MDSDENCTLCVQIYYREGGMSSRITGGREKGSLERGEGEEKGGGSWGERKQEERGKIGKEGNGEMGRQGNGESGREGRNEERVRGLIGEG